MEGFFLSTTFSSTTSKYCSLRLWVPSCSAFRQYRSNISLLPRKPRKKEVLLVYAAASNSNKDEVPELDKWEQMELKFGGLIGEDPKLTLAKIMGRKANPELSFLEIEKIYKSKGKAGFSEIVELPFDVSDIRKPSNSKGKSGISEIKEVPLNVSDVRKPSNSKANSGISEIKEVPRNVSDVRKPSNPTSRLNLVRPVPKKGVKFETNDKPSLIAPSGKRLNQQAARMVDNSKQSRPTVNLRKPTSFYQDGVGTEKSLGLSEEWDLSVKTGERQSKERLSDTKLVRKPDPYVLKNEEEASEEVEAIVSNSIKENTGIKSGTLTDVSLMQKPEIVNLDLSSDQEPEDSMNAVDVSNSKEDGISTGVSLLQKPEIVNLDLIGDQKQSDPVNAVEENYSLEDGTLTDVSLLQKPKIVYPDENGDQKRNDTGCQSGSDSDTSAETVTVTNINLEPSLESGQTLLLRDHSALVQRQPKRLDHSAEKMLTISGEGTSNRNPGSSGNAFEYESIAAMPPLKEYEEIDWGRAEDLLKQGGREDVEVVKVTARGFAVAFGSLIGFLPYRNVGPRWRYVPFYSWLRRKGLDPSAYEQNLGIVGKYEVTSVKSFLDSSIDSKADTKVKIEGKVSPDLKFEDILSLYEQEKLKYLSSLVGQKLSVYVVLADRDIRKLIFSAKLKEKEDSIMKKKRLMAKLSIGDVVKCCVKKIAYFGILVEVEGVPALIHQSEVSWDATLDPAAYFKSGQIIEAKVTQLDFSLQRISLSLKEIMPDPLFETLKSVLRDQPPSDGSLETEQADTEWSDVESLIKELRQYEGIQAVSKGRYFLSPGLAPTFQVYMASRFEDQYKLLARSGNKVQEVIVETSLTKEEMKSAILTCTNRLK